MKNYAAGYGDSIWPVPTQLDKNLLFFCLLWIESDDSFGPEAI